MEPISYRIRLNPDKKLHSREHVLADDLSRMMGESKRFASYLGISHRYYESDLRALARYVMEKKDLPVGIRGKYFFGALKGLPKKRLRIKKVKKKTKVKVKKTDKKSVKSKKKK